MLRKFLLAEGVNKNELPPVLTKEELAGMQASSCGWYVYDVRGRVPYNGGKGVGDDWRAGTEEDEDEERMRKVHYSTKLKRRSETSKMMRKRQRDG
jgi:hypothetical protein